MNLAQKVGNEWMLWRSSLILACAVGGVGVFLPSSIVLQMDTVGLPWFVGVFITFGYWLALAPFFKRWQNMDKQLLEIYAKLSPFITERRSDDQALAGVLFRQTPLPAAFKVNGTVVALTLAVFGVLYWFMSPDSAVLFGGGKWLVWMALSFVVAWGFLSPLLIPLYRMWKRREAYHIELWRELLPKSHTLGGCEPDEQRLGEERRAVRSAGLVFTLTLAMSVMASFNQDVSVDWILANAMTGAMSIFGLLSLLVSSSKCETLVKLNQLYAEHCGDLPRLAI